MANIVIGEYHRLKTTPNYSWVKPLRILKPRTQENPTTHQLVECEHVVSKGDKIGLIRRFRLHEIEPITRAG